MVGMEGEKVDSRAGYVLLISSSCDCETSSHDCKIAESKWYISCRVSSMIYHTIYNTICSAAYNITLLYVQIKAAKLVSVLQR